MILREVAEAAEGRFHPEDSEVPVGMVVIDSREAGEGDLFFALKGSRTDGHEYVDQVLERGGYAVVSRGGERRGVVLVDDVEQALFQAAARRRKDIDSTVVGITGSSGKTTTRKMLAAVLRTSYSVYSTSGNLNNQLGLPLTILNSPEESPEMMVLELGMNHAGELLRLGGLAKPAHCLVTNIGRAHMEFFSDLKGVERAKAELIETTESGGVCVIPTGRKILRRIAMNRGLEILYTGKGRHAWPEFENGGWVLRPWNVPLKLQLSGRHNACNAASAVLMAVALGVAPETAASALSAVEPHRGRGRVLKLKGATVIDESYNANPDSTLACLAVLNEAPGPRGAVLGDMLELGEDAPRCHREVLEKADSMGLDFLILTGSLYRESGYAAENTRTFYADDWREALELFRETLRSPCTVLIKGSNSIGLGRMVRELEVNG